MYILVKHMMYVCMYACIFTATKGPLATNMSNFTY